MTDTRNDQRPAQPLSERRQMIVMFCDVVDSTRLSRQKGVESYFAVLRAYYDACQSVVARHDGFVAQHHGDGIYIWFGYPSPHEDDALRAVRAGLDLLVVLKRVSERIADGVGDPLQVRIAAHAGEVLVASVPQERGPLAFGHTPNVAAKLQQTARPGTMVISDELLKLVERDVDVVPRPAALGRDGTASPAFEVIQVRQRAGRIAATWRTPLVGRDVEVERLKRLWMDVGEGRGRTLAIVGDRGVGKTRLASTLATWAATQGATVLDCACNRLDTNIAYRTMRLLVATAAGIEEGEQPIVSAARLQNHLEGALGMPEHVASVIGASLGLTAGAIGDALRLDPRRLAQLSTEGLLDWLRRTAAAAPTIVTIDDVAETDPSSLEILARLVADPPARLLVVLTAHSLTSLPGPLQGEQTEVVALAPLSDPDAEELIAAVTSAAPLELQISERIVRQGDGIPLYLEELSRTAQEVSQTTLPITLTGYLQAGLAASVVDREVVGVLAVAGRVVEEDVMTEVLRVDRPALRERLAGLLRRDLVIHLTDAGSHYRFRHGLIAETAYGMLLNEDRIRLHGRLADVMIARNGHGHRHDWSLVGHHLNLANRPVEAFEALLSGADQARVTGATQEALLSYRVALDVLDKIEDTGIRDRLEIRGRMQRGATAISAKGWGADEAMEDFTRSVELCRTLGPRPEHLAAVSGVFSFYLIQGDLAPARRLAEELRDWVDAAHDDNRADNGLGFGVLCFYEGDYSGARTHLQRTVRLFDTQQRDNQAEQAWLLPFDALVLAHTHLANIAWICGLPGEANAAGDRALLRAATLPFPEGPFSMAYAKSFLAWTHNLAGQYDTAAELATDVATIGERHGFALWESGGAIHLAIAEHGLGRKPDAADLVSMHVAFWELLRSRVFLPYFLTTTAQMRLEGGNRDQAVAGFEAAGRLAEETGSLFYEAERLRLIARSGLGTPEESRELLDRARKIAQGQGALIFELRAALDMAKMAPSLPATQVLERVISKFVPGVGYPEINEARALLAQTVTRT